MVDTAGNDPVYDISAPEYYINRELSWLEFDHRVLEEAMDVSTPLFERLKFSAIVSSNLDEFYMVRVGSLGDQISVAFLEPDIAGLTPHQQIEHISWRVHELVRELYNCYNNSLVPLLVDEGIMILPINKLDDKQQEFVRKHFEKNIFPVLTPMAVDTGRPFPLIHNRSLNIALLLCNEDQPNEELFATVEIPSVLDRLIEVPASRGNRVFVLLEDVIREHISRLYEGHRVKKAGYYRVTRNADLNYDEEGAEDLLESIQQSLRQRRWGQVMRLEVENRINVNLLATLQEKLEVPDRAVHHIKGPLDLTFLMKLASLEGYAYLRHEPLNAARHPDFINESDYFSVIQQKDVLLHMPYQSFQPVTELVQQAAADPNVLAIKMTLYRVSGNSPILATLVKAAERGKQVTALVELKARFDEENNIVWAKRLEEAGCHVIYGLVGLKTHGKLLLIVRREEDGIKRYLHLSTGNYNDITASIYEDYGLFTADPYLCSDAAAIFNMLSGYSRLGKMHKITVAPVGLRNRFLELINQETANALAGKDARIVAKMNALIDPQIIQALYKASQAGVQVELIVRGICSLRPGVTGISENIRVISIVGRFLEHSRIYYFWNDGQELIYLSSADWMQRNLDRRVELLFPIESPELRQEIKESVALYFSEIMKTRILKPDGLYKRPPRRPEGTPNLHDLLIRRAHEAQKRAIIVEPLPEL